MNIVLICMGFRYSDLLRNIRPSEIRQLSKYAASKDVISFSGGMPNPLTFPIADMEKIMDDVLEESGDIALQYGNTGGLDALKSEIKRLVKETENINVDEQDIIVTSGSQQGLYELGKILVNPGEPIITEEPTYVGAISAFDANLADFHSVDMDEEGMRTDQTEDVVKKLVAEGRSPKFIYVIPTFQNPTGITMNEDRRKHILEIASRYDIPVIEDNPYGELRFSGRRMPTLKSLDQEDRVIYLGTFSKIMCPGLRIGYTVAPTELISKINLLKQALDLSSSTFSQFVAWQYLKRNIHKKQIPKSIALYRTLKDTMLDALNEYFPEGSSWSKPDGGMFLWATVDPSINTTDMLKEALASGVIYVSGNAFSPAKKQWNSMRLNYTFSDEAAINSGIRKLSELLKKKLSYNEPVSSAGK